MQGTRPVKRLKPEPREAAKVASKRLRGSDRPSPKQKQKPKGKSRDIQRSAEVADRRRRDAKNLRNNLAYAKRTKAELKQTVRKLNQDIKQMVEKVEITDEQMLDRFEDFVAARLMDSKTTWSIQGYRCFRDMVVNTGVHLAKVGTAFGKSAIAQPLCSPQSKWLQVVCGNISQVGNGAAKMGGNFLVVRLHGLQWWHWQQLMSTTRS